MNNGPLVFFIFWLQYLDIQKSSVVIFGLTLFQWQKHSSVTHSYGPKVRFFESTKWKKKIINSMNVKRVNGIDRSSSSSSSSPLILSIDCRCCLNYKYTEKKKFNTRHWLNGHFSGNENRKTKILFINIGFWILWKVVCVWCLGDLERMCQVG